MGIHYFSWILNLPKEDFILRRRFEIAYDLLDLQSIFF